MGITTVTITTITDIHMVIRTGIHMSMIIHMIIHHIPTGITMILSIINRINTRQRNTTTI